MVRPQTRDGRRRLRVREAPERSPLAGLRADPFSMALPVLLLVLLALVPTSEVGALTRLEGEYQIMLDLRKTDRAFLWDFDANSNETWAASQFRLFTVPFRGTEAFVKFEADWNPGTNDYARPVFQYRESHLRFRWDLGNKGADLYLFQRQDRFWVENHLIEIVRPGNLTDFGNAQGLRLDLWAPGPTNVTFIASDFSGQSNPGAGAEAGKPVPTDDAYVLRLRRKFLEDRLRVGITYNRRVEAEAADPSAYQEVLALDLRYTLQGGTDVLLEYADSKARRTPEHVEGRFRLRGFNLRRPDWWLPSDGVLRGEIRAIRIGNPRWGFYNIVPTFWYYGPGFVNPLGDGNRDEQGVWINTWYLLPQRAVTLTLNYTGYERRVFDHRRFRSWYVEIYTEYVNGFTSKLAYNDRKTTDRNDPRFDEITYNRDLFAEVQVESPLAWMRVQGKITDLGTPRRKVLASLETAVNITSKLKIYTRYAFGNDPARLRKALFTQLQYRPSGNMDVFLEYGPGWIGDSPNPVDDGDLAGGGEMRDLVKLIVRGNF
jgi:hypothetical protein